MTYRKPCRLGLIVVRSVNAYYNALVTELNYGAFMTTENHIDQYQRMSHDKHGKPYYRMFPSGEWPDYYETCGVSDFNRHFKAVDKEPTA